MVVVVVVVDDVVGVGVDVVDDCGGVGCQRCGEKQRSFSVFVGRLRTRRCKRFCSCTALPVWRKVFFWGVPCLQLSSFVCSASLRTSVSAGSPPTWSTRKPSLRLKLLRKSFKEANSPSQ